MKRGAAGGRGNEMVTGDDMDSRVERSSTTRWDRIPNAIEYLRRYIQEMETRARAPNAFAKQPVEAIKLMDELYQLKEQLQKLLKTPTETVYDIMRFTVVPKVMEEAETLSLTVNGIGRVNVMDDISVKVLEKEEFYAWLVSSGNEDLITETVNAQTLAAWMRARLKNKEAAPVPKNLIEVTPVTRAQITRS